MWVVSQPDRQLAPGLDFGVPRRTFQINKLTGCRRAKAMHAAPLDAQRVTTLPDVAFQAILPTSAPLRQQIDKALGRVQFVQDLRVQNRDFPNPPAFAQQLHLAVREKDFVGAQLQRLVDQRSTG